MHGAPIRSFPIEQMSPYLVRPSAFNFEPRAGRSLPRDLFEEAFLLQLVENALVDVFIGLGV